MKRKIFALFALVLFGLSLTACGGQPEKEGISVVAAIFPEYDWARQIIGDCTGVQLHFLVDDGVDPHSFQPSVADLVTVSECDLLIYGGGESDKWLEDVLAEPANKSIRSIALLPLLGEKAHTEEIVTGMQGSETEEEADEHVWLSIRNATLFCTAIAQALCEMDPGQAEHYQANLEAYLKKLSELDEAYRQTVQAASKDTIVVCDRFPYRYLTEDYNLHYYAAFPGCSAETGASFETVVFLADRVRELELDALLVTETGDQQLAKTVAENAGRGDMAILTLNSMQSVSAQQAASLDYLSVMEQNRLVLEQALG